MLAADRRKLSNVIMSQSIKENPVNDLELSIAPGLEAVAVDMIAAIQHGDSKALASALHAMSEIISHKDDYESGNTVKVKV